LVLKFTGSGDIRRQVDQVMASWPDLAGLVVIDIPAGKGRLSRLLQDCGARVEAYDLIPEFFEADGITCNRADLTTTLPIPDRHADIVICQEGIEHLPDQLHLFSELSRILKPGGRLLVTTPNDSNLRAKVSRVLVESDLYNRQPPNELDAVWFLKDGERYFGHLFLVGIQKIRVLARLQGLQIKRLFPVKVSHSALLLGILYPLVLLFSLLAYWRASVKARTENAEESRRVHREILRLNLDPRVLFGKHLFIELEKMDAPGVIAPDPTRSRDSIL
jgi:SAM-dependent methyltransferase